MLPTTKLWHLTGSAACGLGGSHSESEQTTTWKPHKEIKEDKRVETHISTEKPTQKKENGLSFKDEITVWKKYN